MKRRNIPLILMLVAGAVTGIITCVKGYSIVEKLTALLISLVVFYLIGVCFKILLDVLTDRMPKGRRRRKKRNRSRRRRKRTGSR